MDHNNPLAFLLFSFVKPGKKKGNGSVLAQSALFPVSARVSKHQKQAAKLTTHGSTSDAFGEQWAAKFNL